MRRPVSVILTAYNRKHQLVRTLNSIFAQRYPCQVVVVDDGSSDGTDELEAIYPIEYYRLERPEWVEFCRPTNVGIRKAVHDLLIMQSAEVRYLQFDGIARIVKSIENDRMKWLMCNVRAETEAGSKTYIDYCSTITKRPCSFFLTGLWRKHLVEIGGMDEDYVLPGYSDNDLADRLTKGVGLKQVFDDTIFGEHQWHPKVDSKVLGTGKKLYIEKSTAWSKGEIGYVRNLGRRWGAL